MTEIVLVTGSSGFIGRYLTEELERSGYGVIPFDIVNGHDFMDRKQVEGLFRDFEIATVCHLGAQAHLGPAEQDPVENARVNIIGAINIFEAALRNQARVIYHSTGAVYDDGCPQPVDENAPRKPKSHYGCSKLCAEEYLRLYVRRGLEGIITRFSSVYGIGREVAPVNIFTRKAVAGEEITIFGKDVTRDYTHVNDVVRGVRTIVDDLVYWDGSCYNIASGEPTSTIQVVELIEDVLEQPVAKHILPAKKGDVLQNFFDISLIRDTLLWEPEVALQEGVEELIEHYSEDAR